MTFDNFYKENKTKIFFYALKKLNSKESAEDISSETFFKVYKNWQSLEIKQDNEIKAWTYTVCRNLIIDNYRKKKMSSIEIEPEDDYENMITTLISEENSLEVHNAIKKLDSEKQEILELRFGQGLSIKDVAKVIGKKEGACKMMLYRTLKELKGYLS